VYSRRGFPGLDDGHLKLWAKDLQSGRRGGVPRTVAQHGLWDMVTVYVHRQRSGGWLRGGLPGMMRARKCRRGTWMDMRGEERTRNALQLKSRLAVLESHRGQVWNEELGMGGRSGMVHLGGCHRYDYTCEYRGLRHGIAGLYRCKNDHWRGRGLSE
jgi:hypothetical protein